MITHKLNLNVMKKLILLALLVAGFATYQPAKAQVSLNINIGAQPSYYPTGYNNTTYYKQPYVQRVHYVPARKYVYKNGKHYNKRSYRPIIVQRTNYNRPVNRYYSVKKESHKQHNKAYKHNKDHGKRKY